LYYYGERFYSPELMRWLNRDPIGVNGGLNEYGFAGNNPVCRIDMLGLFVNQNAPPGKVSKPCCGGKIYNPSISCCIDGVITSRMPQGTGVAAVTEYGRTDPFFNQARNWLVKHAWIEFPGGSTGFGPNGNPYWPHPGLVAYPNDGSGGVRNDKTRVNEIKLSPCNYDIQKFVDCVSSKPIGEESTDFTGHHTTGRLYCVPWTDCRHYQQRLIMNCLNKAAR
jgi:uncharacterized protein RhaS with RHS repeats